MSGSSSHSEQLIEAVRKELLTVRRTVDDERLEARRCFEELVEQFDALHEALTAIATGKVPTTYGGGAYSHRSLAREALSRVSTPASMPEPCDPSRHVWKLTMGGDEYACVMCGAFSEDVTNPATSSKT